MVLQEPKQEHCITMPQGGIPALYYKGPKQRQGIVAQGPKQGHCITMPQAQTLGLYYKGPKQEQEIVAQDIQQDPGHCSTNALATAGRVTQSTCSSCCTFVYNCNRIHWAMVLTNLESMESIGSTWLAN